MDAANRYLPALGRLFLGLLFILAGLNKIAAPDAMQAYIASAGLPLPFLAYIVAIIVEVGGGILILVGYQTRFVALAMAAFSIVTALAFHTKFGDQAQLTNFFKNIAIAGGFLQVAAFGAGHLSVDAWLAAGRKSA